MQGDAAEAARFCGRHGNAPICIPDPQKESYRAMGFPRTSWKTILFASPELKARRQEVRAAGCRMDLAGTFQEHSDALQLPGAALIARGGAFLWVHRGTHPGDLPPAEVLLRIFQDRLHPQRNADERR